MTLELTALSKRYDGFAFGPVDLSVGSEVLAVLGPSGSGKTTLLSLLSGIVTPDGGEISLDGRSLRGVSLEARGTGLVFQDGALFPHLTARENVAYAATSTARVDDLAALLEVESVLDRRPGALSGGERQRVALARTLAADPGLLLLDEPLSSLDAPIRRRLREQLHDLFASLDIPVIYVTHDQRAATVLGDRVAVLHDGHLEQVGTPEAILDRPRTPFVARFTGSENVFEAVVERDGDGDSAALRVGDASLRTRTTRPAGETVTACVRPSRIDLLGGPAHDGELEDRGDRTPTNTVVGTVHRRVNEGDVHRLSVDVDGTTFVASLRPATVERVAPQPGSAVRLSIPPAAVHVIE